MPTSLSTAPPPTAPAPPAARPGRRRRRPPSPARHSGLHRTGTAPVDRLTPFRPAVLAVRWSTTAATVALCAAGLDGDPSLLAWAAVVTAVSLVQTLAPRRDDGSARSLTMLLAEVGVHLLVVAATGLWSSPLVLSVVTAVIVAGFARGFAVALRVALALAIAITAIAVGRGTPEVALASQWTTILVLVAIVAGYARRISGEAARQNRIALDRLNRMADANALLFSLHRIAQTLPASLDIEEVLDSSLRRLRGLVEHHSAALLLVDDTDGSWLVGRCHGLRMESRLDATDLPAPAVRAATAKELQLVADLSAGGPGFAAGSGTGIYLPLTARGSLVGLLAVEHRMAGHFGPRDVEILHGFVEPVALAIDNARWFARLRTVSADEERTRIARDLHDRIGQSLAYLAFELDRIVVRDEAGDSVSTQLVELRRDLRGVIGEVRDTLYDLRTDVTEDKDLPAVIGEFCGRIAERSGLIIDIDGHRQGRLSLHQERELWRIAQEAITNIERHAAATHVHVLWRCDGSTAALEVRDDGTGFPTGKAGRLDSYGILGMKERASSIGATLKIESRAGEGTTVRCYLDQR